MLESIKTDHNCPECGSNLLFDAEKSLESSELLVNIYCENSQCDYYNWVYVDPISREIHD